MDPITSLVNFLADTFFAPPCASDPCSNGAHPDHVASYDHPSYEELHDVQYAAEQEQLWCSAGHDAGIGIDFTSDWTASGGTYGDWHQL